jgi:secreted Zn-dependent insulinase-like peptidase
VEKQLGYAVFSALRQIHGQTGILFGVQSPDVAPLDLLEHIEHFLRDLEGMIDTLDDVTFNGQRQALANQFDSAALPATQATELLWQGKLAGHSSDYLVQLPRAILLIDRPALVAAARRLNQAEGGWRCLASGPCPNVSWQVTK